MERTRHQRLKQEEKKASQAVTSLNFMSCCMLLPKEIHFKFLLYSCNWFSFYFLIDTLIFLGKSKFSILFIVFSSDLKGQYYQGFLVFLFIYIYTKGHNSFMTSETKMNKIKYCESLPMVMMFDS